NLKAGDSIKLHPKAPPLRVNLCDAPNTLAIEGWIFHLIPMGPSKTRLLSRTYKFDNARLDWVSNLLINSPLFELAHFIMGRKQLLEIKRLAEERVARFSDADLLPGERKMNMAKGSAS
ncbi:MAG TPA: hypothetical protein VFV50_13355, partial [Bdellovibrionales bacterium]|nr:hypothetical protein [Bdellovibrionales bacterium]